MKGNLVLYTTVFPGRWNVFAMRFGPLLHSDGPNCLCELAQRRHKRSYLGMQKTESITPDGLLRLTATPLPKPVQSKAVEKGE